MSTSYKISILEPFIVTIFGNYFLYRIIHKTFCQVTDDAEEFD